MPTYTDKELQLATQVAYAKLGNAYDTLCEEKGRTTFTIQELMDKAGVSEIEGLGDYSKKMVNFCSP